MDDRLDRVSNVVARSRAGTGECGCAVVACGYRTREAEGKGVNRRRRIGLHCDAPAGVDRRIFDGRTGMTGNVVRCRRRANRDRRYTIRPTGCDTNCRRASVGSNVGIVVCGDQHIAGGCDRTGVNDGFNGRIDVVTGAGAGTTKCRTAVGSNAKRSGECQRVDRLSARGTECQAGSGNRRIGHFGPYDGVDRIDRDRSAQSEQRATVTAATTGTDTNRRTTRVGRDGGVVQRGQCHLAIPYRVGVGIDRTARPNLGQGGVIDRVSRAACGTGKVGALTVSLVALTARIEHASHADRQRADVTVGLCLQGHVVCRS